MSSNLELGDSLHVNSLLTIGSKKLVEIARGPLESTVQRTSANNFSASSISFQVQCNNNLSTIIDPYMYIELGLTVTMTGSVTGGVFTTVKESVEDAFALRQYPLASITNVCAVTINTQSESSSPSNFIHTLSSNQEFLSGAGQAIMQSLTPIMPDQAPQYSTLAGSNKNPLAGYLTGGDLYSEPRGSFNSLFTDVVNNATTWTFTYTLREPIFNPLLEYDPSKQREGLAYVNKFEVYLNLLANLSRAFSLDATTCPLVTGLSVQINSANLVQTWVTAPLNMTLPDVVVRGYNSIFCNSTVQTPFTPGQQRTIISQSYQVSQIPKKLYIAVVDSELDTSTGYHKSDYSFSIEAITVLFNNRGGVLSTYQDADLYNACMADEGSVFSFVQAKKFTGMCLVVDPSKLLGLREDEAPGLLGNYQLQINLTCTNISSSTVTPYLWVDWALDTLFTIDKSNVSNKIQGFITPADVLAASSLPAIPSSSREDNIYGGRSGIKKFGDLLKKGVKYIKDKKLISKGLKMIGDPRAQAAAEYADRFGLGYGGQRYSKSQLMSQALRY